MQSIPYGQFNPFLTGNPAGSPVIDTGRFRNPAFRYSDDTPAGKTTDDRLNRAGTGATAKAFASTPPQADTWQATASKHQPVRAESSEKKHKNPSKSAKAKTKTSTKTDTSKASPSQTDAAPADTLESLGSAPTQKTRASAAKKPAAPDKNAAKPDTTQQKPDQKHPSTSSPATQSTASLSLSRFPFTQFAEAQHPQQPEPPPQAINDASKMVALYKIGFAVVGAGFINSMFFGSPLAISIGLALTFASAQSLLALKICREDTALSRKLLSLSRKITGSEHDNTQSGKERAMAPIWALVSSGLALTEATLNVLLNRYKNRLPFLKDMKLENKSLSEQEIQLRASLQNTPSPAIKARHSLIRAAIWLKGVGDKTAEKCFPTVAPGATFASFRNGLSHFMRDGAYKYHRGFVWAGLSAFAGGYIQSILAAQVHERLEAEKRQQSHPSATV